MMSGLFVSYSTMDRIADAVHNRCNTFADIPLAPKGSRTRVGRLLYELHTEALRQQNIPRIAYAFEKPDYAEPTPSRAQAEQWAAIMAYLKATESVATGTRMVGARESLTRVSMLVAYGMLRASTALVIVPAHFPDRTGRSDASDDIQGTKRFTRTSEPENA